MNDKYFTNDPFDAERSVSEQTNAYAPFQDDSETNMSDERYAPLPWEETSLEPSDNSRNFEYEVPKSATFDLSSVDLFDAPTPQIRKSVKRQKRGGKPFQTSALGYLTTFCLIAALAVFAFCSFSKLKLNAVGDLETVARLHVGSCVRCDAEVVGIVKKLDLQTGTAKLELERDSLIPSDSQFVFSSKKYGSHIEIIRGTSEKTLKNGDTVSLASEFNFTAIDPALVREKIEQGIGAVVKTSKDVGKATGLDPKFVLCCIVLLTFLVAAFVFRRVKAASSLACFGAFLSFLCLVVRWLPEIQTIVATIMEAFQQ